MKTNFKRIIAVTTLTAMALTGNIVSTFAMAEEAEVINETVIETSNETVNEEEVFAEEVTAACVDEIVGEADMSLTEEGAEEIALTENGEALPTDEEAVEEVEEADLGELTGEAEEEAEPRIEEEDKQQLMADMIDMAVDDTRDQGIYAALNATFATLADNAEALANPETGVIETDGNAIVNMTYDALSANFDNNPEQLMGAIGAAALRADNAGYIQALGGDQQLMLMALTEDERKAAKKETNKYLKSIFDSSLDSLAVAFPKFKPFVPILKALGGNLFDMGGTPDYTNADVIARIDELEAEVKKATDNLKDHTYNVVQLSALGDKYNTVADKAATIRTYIGDIELDINKSDAQKLQEIADLYKDSEFKSLVSAMNGATRCFTSRENDIFENQNVFEAAYSRACEEVMFSKEAIDMTLPYLARQLNTYLAAYATMARVFDAQVAVYGESAVLQSRKEMSLRLTGCDLDGNKVQKSVFDLYEDYFNRDKFIFVKKSNNTNIKLNSELLVGFDYARQCTNDKEAYWKCTKATDQMKNNPLSADDVTKLAEYCKEKNTSLFELLFNNVGFEPKLMILRPKLQGGQYVRIEPFNKWYCDDSDGMGWSREQNKWVVTEWGKNNLYLATGKQEISCEGRANGSGEYAGSIDTYYANGINMSKVGATNEKKKLVKAYTSSSVQTIGDKDYQRINLVFFQPR